MSTLIHAWRRIVVRCMFHGRIRYTGLGLGVFRFEQGRECLGKTKLPLPACFFLEQAPNHRLNDLKLMKLLYLAERESLRLFTATISGSTFASLKNGPVLREVLDLFASGEGQSSGINTSNSYH